MQVLEIVVHLAATCFPENIMFGIYSLFFFFFWGGGNHDFSIFLNHIVYSSTHNDLSITIDIYYLKTCDAATFPK